MTERDTASTAGGSVGEPSAPAEELQPPETSGAVEEAVTTPAGVAPPRARGGRRTNAPVALRPVRASLSGLREKMESTAALRESLDAKEAEAQDLRASIEQLRQELDTERSPGAGAAAGAATATAVSGRHTRPSGPADPPTPDQPTRGRLTSWVLVVAAVLVAAALLLAARGNSRSTSPSGAQTPAQAASGQAAPSPAASPEPMAWGGSRVLEPPGLPTSGPGIDAPGSVVAVVTDSDGTSVDTYERAVFATPRTDPLVLQVPQLAVTAHPSLQDVQVAMDGTPVEVTRTAAGSLTASTPGGSYRSVVVRYRLAGAIVRWAASKPGRVDAVVVPQTGDLSRQAAAPVRLQSSEPGIVAVNCYVSASQILAPCAGPPVDGVWTATLPQDSASGVALITLDR